MADRYWVGGSGDWNNTAHWSASSGGAGSAGVPTSSDNASIDNNSGGPAITITTTAVCKDFTINVSGAANTMSLIADATNTDLQVYGSWSVTASGGAGTSLVVRFVFKSTATGNTLSASPANPFAGDGIGTHSVSGFRFDGIGGGWTFNSSLSVDRPDSGTGVAVFQLINGTVDLNGNSIRLGTHSLVATTGGSFSSLLLSAGTSITLGVGTIFTGPFTGNGTISSLITINGGSISATTASVSYINVTGNTAAGGGIPFVDTNGIDGGGNVNWLFPRSAPFTAYNSSLITAVQRSQQSLSLPQFVIAGVGGAAGTTYALFKKNTTYGSPVGVWRSQVFAIGKNFDVTNISFNLISSVVSTTKIIPVLYFDDSATSSVGTTIDSLHYSIGEKYFSLTSKDFLNTVRGKDNFFLEFQFYGTTLDVVGLPISLDLEIYDT